MINFKQLWTDLIVLCHADPRVLITWLDNDKEKIQSCLIWLILGSSLYGTLVKQFLKILMRFIMFGYLVLTVRTASNLKLYFFYLFSVRFKFEAELLNIVFLNKIRNNI